MSDNRPELPEWIAKDCLDIGLFTNRLEEMLSFWQIEVGLAFDHVLPLGGGVRQHRHTFETAILKLNHTRTLLAPRTPGGLLRLIVGKADVSTPKDLVDPDENQIRLVPKGYEGVDHWAIEIATSSFERFFDHYETRLGLPRDLERTDAVRCGRSLIVGVEAPDIADETDRDEMMGLGFRYTTVQVFKTDAVHQRALVKGAAEGAPPKTLGKTARISFLKDAHGNWMELSQRASITGSLEPA